MLFEKHKYALDRIGRLTPQALVILNDSDNWPQYKLGNYQSSSGVITSDWIRSFTPIYATTRGVTDEKKFRRISHTIKELLTDGLLRSRLPGQNDSRDYSSVKEAENTAIVEPTELGEEILSYIKGED